MRILPDTRVYLRWAADSRSLSTAARKKIAGAAVTTDAAVGEKTAFELKREKAVPAFLSTLKTVRLAESLGGVESIVTHPSTMTHADIPLEEQAAVGLTPSLVQLSVGIEDRGELQADISQTLRKA